MKKAGAVFLAIFSSVFFSQALFAQNTDGSPAKVLSGEIQEGIRVVKVIASKYKFSPDPVIIKAGEKVRFIVSSADVTHGLAIKEFKVNTVVEPGKTSTVEFVASKDGTFTIFCSVYCGPGHSHMHGTLIVLK